jgi:hypothetical protein
MKGVDNACWSTNCLLFQGVILLCFFLIFFLMVMADEIQDAKRERNGHRNRQLEGKDKSSDQHEDVSWQHQQPI